MADEPNLNPLEGFPSFEPVYNSDEIEHLNGEEDRAWKEAFRHEWTTKGHQVVPHEKPEWVYWASRLCTQKMIKRLYNHQIGKAGRDDSWGNIAAVVTNPVGLETLSFKWPRLGKTSPATISTGGYF
ncbi:Ff.00g078870.m01.CDS01 [Fusarium sp. VM40]|nr:Ff.00g078870.m01.CDS01 [Fusarium sp. VM40]